MTRPDFNPYAAPAETTKEDYDAPSEYDVQRLATPVQRFVGNFVDTLVIMFPAVFAYIPILTATVDGVTIADDTFETLDTKAWVMLGLGVSVVLGIAVVQAVMISNTGQSLGKRLMKTKIVRLDGSNPGFLYGVFLRSFVGRLGGFIPGVGNLYNLADALFVFRSDRRTIHDHIAGTRVIQL